MLNLVSVSFGSTVSFFFFGTHSFCRGGLSGSVEGRSYIGLETSYECYRDKEFSGFGRVLP